MAMLLYISMGSSSKQLTAQQNLLPKTPSPPLLQSSLVSVARRNTRSSSHVAMARRSGLSSRARRLEKRGKKATKEEEEEEEIVEASASADSVEFGGGGMEYSTEPMPKLEGLEPDFWEGPQWDGLGFFVQYMWAFGILFGLISGGIAAATYNEGATDFKKTPAYKESIQSQELLEEPDASSSDVFEANPTEDAPSLE